jgi:very-short-patch-repair endonuclease
LSFNRRGTESKLVFDLNAQRERLTKLFEFLRAYVELRYPPVREISQQLRTIWLKDLPAFSTVELIRDAGSSVESAEGGDVVMRIKRPNLTPCPPPPQPLLEWLWPGWRDFPGEAEVLTTRNVVHDGVTTLKRFEDQTDLAAHWNQWRQQRERWVANERPARKAMELFETIYEWFGAIVREGNKVELLLGDGLVRCRHEKENFCHPVLLQKMELEFFADKKPPEFIMRNRETPPELYVEFLRTLPGADISQLTLCVEELKKAEFTPLGSDGTDGFLRRLIQGLFPSRGEVVAADRDASDIPTIERQPVLFLRQRRAGQSNIYDLILKDIGIREVFPPALLQILSLVDDAALDASVGESSELGNEDEEILLSKPANREQLKIAKQLARGKCVLVQGPPGTGKTHTIANLLGHLLAQGKRVLVTAHTPKALRVLRAKVVEALQPLCVSVLQNDKRSQEELQDSVRVIHLRLGSDVGALEGESKCVRQERKRLLIELGKTRKKLLDALQDETRDVVFDGTTVRPIEAARRIKTDTARDGWIPSPIKLGEAIPLSHAEVTELYQTNARVSQADERELKCFRPDLAALPTATEFARLVEELKSLLPYNLRFREELWDATREPEDLAEFDRMLNEASKTIEFLRDCAAWQLEAVQAGKDGEIARRTWSGLVEKIEAAWSEIQVCHVLVMEHGPSVSDPRLPHQLVPLLDEVIAHHQGGGGFGLLTKMTKGRWFEFQKTARIGNQEMDLKSLHHLQAVRGLLRIQQLREELTERWDRQMACKGAAAKSDLGDTPEAVCKQYIPSINGCLDWHALTWQPLETDFERLGFQWPAFLASTTPETGANAELNRLRGAVLGDLGPILQSRSGWLRSRRIISLLAKWSESIPASEKTDSLATQRLRAALRDSSQQEYQAAIEELGRLANLEEDLETRRELLERLAPSASAWSSAIQGRIAPHDSAITPGNPITAWEWRQLHDELERRASVSLDQIQHKIEDCSGQLLGLTSQLSEKETWIKQIRNTKDAQKQALGAYATFRGRLTKTGRGVQDADNRAAARREMAMARDAVPVWIMPLAEVADTFDPAKTRFDVVIIDEASQCDAASMFALYLGEQTIIVGDDEQVTPVAVGQDTKEVKKLIQVYLEGIAHKELLDGQTSIYELAQIAFGSVVRLTEHFRCAPNIIAFSNNLSYRGEIKPLREASSIRLTPHVVPYRVEAGVERGDNVNEVEALAIASLICAAAEQHEYAKNEQGETLSFGVVSLVGDKQALKIDSLLRRYLDPAEYLRRQILCGDAAQFQGDERDVMFLSVVDSPPENPPLSMRQEGPKKIFKKRYNVAASRARNQMWVVHSLNRETDLQPMDYRRRIIEHALDPEAWERDLQNRLEQVDVNSKVFEGGVLRSLMERGYDVLPQYQVGAMRIDLVVVGKNDRLAVECDGEQFHGPEKLQEDMDRQAVLERLGWKFVRIRGSLYFRDQERALEPVFRRLEELNITPDFRGTAQENPTQHNEIVERVTRRGQALREEWALGATQKG